MSLFIKLIVISLCLLSSAHSLAAISPRIYNALTELQEKIAQQPNKEDAESIRNDLLELKSGLQGNALGSALTLQTLSMLADYEEKWTLSQQHLVQAIAIKNLQIDTVLQLKAALAFSYFRQEQYKEVISLLEGYIKTPGKEASAGIYALLAASYYGLDSFQLGLPHIEKACSLVKKPKEHWLQMAFSGHYQNKNYSRALSYVNQLVYFHPDKKVYWQQKAGLHQMLEEYPRAASAKYLSYEKGMLEKENEYINLGQLLASQGNPYAVGNAIEKALNNKLFAPSKKVLNLQYQAWLQAKEIKQATDVLSKLYSGFKESKHGISLMQFQLDAQQWTDALNTSKELLNGKFEKEKQKGQVYLLTGIALHQTKRDRQALVKLSQALAFENSASQAKGWMNYIKQKQGI